MVRTPWQLGMRGHKVLEPLSTYACSSAHYDFRLTTTLGTLEGFPHAFSLAA